MWGKVPGAGDNQKAPEDSQGPGIVSVRFSHLVQYLGLRRHFRCWRICTYCAKCVLGHTKIDKARKLIRGGVQEWVMPTV